MLLAHQQHPETYRHWLTAPVWQEALTWIQDQCPKLPDGEHVIHGRDMYANIQTITTKPRTETAYEAHKNYLDLHYCLTGGEIIEWAPVQTLKARTQYDASKDYTLYDPPAQATSCAMTPGTFGIFLPEDAHMPKISDGVNQSVRKVVIKVNILLLNR